MIEVYSRDGVFEAFHLNKKKNEGFLTTARHGYKKGGHGVFGRGREEWGVSPYPTTIGKCGGRIITVNTILVHRFAHFAEGGKLPPPTSTPYPPPPPSAYVGVW